MDQTKLLIVGDHAIFRLGMKQFLSDNKPFQVVGEASDGNMAVEMARALKPDLVLMDLWMPNCDGVEATYRLQAEMPEINVLVLTVSEDEPDLFGAIKAGARGYLLKDDEPENIVQGIQYVAQGGVIISPRGHQTVGRIQGTAAYSLGRKQLCAQPEGARGAATGGPGRQQQGNR